MVRARLDRLRSRRRVLLKDRNGRGDEDDAVSYADPFDYIEQSRNLLFRGRDVDENSSDYRLRVNAQNRLLARERFDEGTRARDRDAIVWIEAGR